MVETMEENILKNSKRAKRYIAFLESFSKGHKTIPDIIEFGYRLMRQAKCHHHFFRDHSLLETAKHLCCFALKTSDIFNQRTITKPEAIQVLNLFERRIEERIPVEYITNEAWYLGNRFYVNEDVLVPRSVMSHRFQDFLKETDWQNHRVLDLCTGSGCIGITLALLNPHIQVDLVDISDKALRVAKMNVDYYDQNNRIQCIQSDLFENLNPKNPYDLIITNPPYVSTSEYKASPLEFKKEPRLALESGYDGLEIIHRILANYKTFLNPDGKLIAEVGSSAAKRLKKQYPHIPFKWYKYRKPNGKESWFGQDFVFELKGSV